MARSNADFNQRLVDEVSRRVPSPAVVAELGFGPGVGLAAILTRFPAAQVYGVDPSAAVQAQALARNSSAARGGRLRLLQGEARALLPFRPLDLVVAVHVLYFWNDPVGSLVQVNGLLSPRGHVALGYQLKQHMPSQAQRDFPKEGHRLYESDEAVTAVLVQAGLTPQEVVVIGPSESPLGRVLIAAAPQRGG